MLAVIALAIEIGNKQRKSVGETGEEREKKRELDSNRESAGKCPGTPS